MRGIDRRRVAAWALTALVGWLAITAVEICRYSSVTDPLPAHAAIVLGTEIWGDQPSPVFRERINHAVDLYHAGVVSKLIFTGGFGEGEQYAESEVAREYAVARGVAREEIHIETESRTTMQNLRGAADIVRLDGTPIHHQHRPAGTKAGGRSCAFCLARSTSTPPIC